MNIHNLCCHRDVDIAIECLNSLSLYLNEDCKIQIHDDGSLTMFDISRIRQQLPNSTVISRSEADAILYDGFLYRYPNMKQARQAIPHMMKIVDITLLDSGDVLTFVDSDVLFLRPFRHATYFHQTHDACFMMDARSCYGFRAKDYWPFGPAKPVWRLNSGMFWIKRKCIDLDWVEWVCARCGLDQILAARSWFEQGLWAAVAGRCECHLFDPRQICTAEDRNAIPRDPVALHFNGPSRRIFDHYAKGEKSPITNVEEIYTIPTRMYSLCEYTIDAAKFRLSRAFG